METEVVGELGEYLEVGRGKEGRNLWSRCSPNPREQAAEEECAIALDEGRKKGEDTVDRE